MENNPKDEYYTSLAAMEPLYPEDANGKLESLALELVEKAGRLSGAMNPITRLAIARFLRPMNSYYSNLIEGHDTHPIDIAKALNNDYSENKTKRDLQLEAKAHINVHESISTEFVGDNPPIPSSENYLKYIHNEFYKHLPEEFKKSKSIDDDTYKIVVPGEFRTCEVKVGNHVAPHSESVSAYMNRFESFYNPTNNSNNSKIKRIISIAASHHRLAWIHPFLDGNGRVVRLYSDSCFMYEKIDASGLWSISRGLARTKETYREKLANADLGRYNDYDGRGNLSNKMLVEFCIYFLTTAIDQIDYMYKMIDTESMIERIERFADLMVAKNKLKIEAKYILTDVFLKGKISKKEAMRITKTSDKTLKALVDSLAELGLITTKMEGVEMIYYVNYSIKFSPLLFPGLYPSQKEIDMMDFN
jgi:Fic family protein